MKPLRIILLAVAGLAVLSCKSGEQKSIEAVLVPSLKAPSTYKFVDIELVKEETLGDELANRLDLYKSFLDSEQRRVDMYADYCKEWSRMSGSFARSVLQDYKEDLAEAQAKYDRTLVVCNYLDSLASVHPAGEGDVTFREYRLTYEAANSFGVPLRDCCEARFNAAGQMVQIRIPGQEFAKILGECFSIPRYYELIAARDGE